MRRDVTASLSFFLGVLALDQLSKRTASPDQLHYNPGLIFGLGVDLPAVLRLVALSSGLAGLKKVSARGRRTCPVSALTTLRA